MRLNEKALAKSLMVVSVGFYLFCVALFTLMPNFSMGIFQSWFHGVDMNKIRLANMPGVGSVLWGLVTFGAVSYLSGYVFARLYNNFSK